jgi:hypothetical protein
LSIFPREQRQTFFRSVETTPIIFRAVAHNVKKIIGTVGNNAKKYT